METALFARPAHSTSARTGSLPRFEPNPSPDDKYKFLSRMPGYTLLLAPQEVLFTVANHKPSTGDRFEQLAASDRVGKAHQANQTTVSPSPVELRMRFVGSNPAAEIEGVDELSTKINRFSGKDSTGWQSNLASFSRVKYRDIYDGIDLLFHGDASFLEYDIIINPHANLSSVRLLLDGAANLTLLKNGALEVETAAGSFLQHAPVIYQEVHGRRIPIKGGFKVLSANQVGVYAELFDPAQPLIVDPVLIYSTRMYRDVLTDNARALAVDRTGASYVAGYVTTATGNQDAFVAKLSPDGTQLLYLTYLGGAGYDIANSIAVDESGHAYVTGQTDSSDFPTASPLQQPSDRSNAFIAKLSPDGSSLDYSTYLGGSGFDFGLGIAVDATGSAYVTGGTQSSDFPVTPGTFQASCGTGPICGSAFVVKLSPSGSALTYSTFLGGSRGDEGNAITVDGSGNAYITGETRSFDFPMAGPVQSACGSCQFSDDAFVAKLDPQAKSLIYSTYLGGDGLDIGYGVAVDESGALYITGYTNSENFPVLNAVQSAKGRGCTSEVGGDAFVAKMTADGSQLVYATYLGGVGLEIGTSIAADRQGHAYVTGLTRSANFPTKAFADESCEVCAVPIDGQVFVARLDSGGSRLIDSIYFGGSEPSQDTRLAVGIVVDAMGDIFVAGSSRAQDFPTTTYLDVPVSVYVAKLTGFDGSEAAEPLPPPGACRDISGAWYIEEDWKVACTVSAAGAGLNIMEQASAAASVRIGQQANSCAITLTPFSPSGAGGFPSLVRVGTVDGSMLSLTGQMGVPVSGVTLVRTTTNRLEASGEIGDRTISLTSQGKFVGTLRNSLGDLLEVDCTGNSSASLLRCSPPKLSQRTATSSLTVVNGASFGIGAVARDSWADVFGSNLATRFVVDGALPASIDGTSLEITDRAGVSGQARLHFVSPDRIQFLVPGKLVPGPATMRVRRAGGELVGAIEIADVAPGLFAANASGQGPAAATYLRVKANGSREEDFTFTLDAPPGRRNVPISLGPAGDQVYISFFGTGFRHQQSVSVSMAETRVAVVGAVAQGQFEGLDQLVVGPLPRSLAGQGELDVRLVTNGVVANEVTISIH